MNIRSICVLALLFCGSLFLQAQHSTFNLGFETPDSTGQHPADWFVWGSQEFETALESKEVYAGKYALKISSQQGSGGAAFGGMGYRIPQFYKGQEIELRGQLKLEGVKDGAVGLVLRLDKDQQLVGFDNMLGQNIQGTQEWQAFSTKLRLPEEATDIILGAILTGSGTLYADELQVLIDGQDISKLEQERTLGYGSVPLLIKNVAYFDTPSEKFKQGDVFVEQGKIKALGKQVKVPEGTAVVEGAGKWLIPGLIDSHVHLFQSGGLYTRPDAMDLTHVRSYDEERAWLRENTDDLLQRYLRLGITTIIDVGGPLANFRIRDQYQYSTAHPSIFLTGPLISTYQPKAFEIDDPPIIKAQTPEQAVALVRQQLPLQPDFIKIWYIVLRGQSPEDTYPIVEATIKEAHAHGLKVAVHATQLETAKLALQAGADVLVHSIDGPVDEEVLSAIKARNVIYIPTLVVGRNYGRVFGRQYVPSAADYHSANPFTLGTLFDTHNESIANRFDRYAAYLDTAAYRQEAEDQIHFDNLRAVLDAKIRVATGTDAGNIGTLHATSFYDELAFMEKAGMSRTEILLASTQGGAEFIGRSEDMGRIATGMQADLVLLNGNPLEGLDAYQQVEAVVKRGKLWDPQQMLLPGPAELAQQQLNAYNAGDIDAFLAPYADSVEVYNFPGALQYKGKDKMRPQYADFFARVPDLHCELVNRIVEGNTVIDQERITGLPNGGSFSAVAIYKIKDGKIAEVHFVRD